MSRVRETTRGWPVGVLFLARLAREGRLEGTSWDVAGDAFAEWRAYVASEVLPSWSDEQRSAAILCAAIPWMSREDAIAELGERAAATFEALSEVGGPVACQGDIYRLGAIFHATVGETLRSAVDAVQRRILEGWLRDGLHLRSAEMFLLRDEPERALHELEAAPRSSGGAISHRELAALEALPLRLLLRSRAPFLELLASPSTHVHAAALAQRVADLRDPFR